MARITDWEDALDEIVEPELGRVVLEVLDVRVHAHVVLLGPCGAQIGEAGQVLAGDEGELVVGLVHEGAPDRMAALQDDRQVALIA